MKRISLLLAGLAALVLAAAPPQGYAANYFVSAAGSDAAAGTDAAPWKTLQASARKLTAGDTLTIRAGTFAGFTLDPDEALAGTKAAPIVIQADPAAAPDSVKITKSATGDGVNLEPGSAYVILKGLYVSGTTRDGLRIGESTGVQIIACKVIGAGRFGISTSHTTDCLIGGCTVTATRGSGTTGHGIYVANSAVRPAVKNCVISGNGSEGLHMNGDLSSGAPGVITAALVDGNAIFANAANGINCDGVQDSTFRRNIVYSNKNHGMVGYRIDGAGPFKNNTISYNTFYGNTACQFKLVDKAAGNSVTGNIFLGGQFCVSLTTDSLANTIDANAEGAKFTTNDGGTALTFALWQGAKGYDAHGFSVNAAIFPNIGANDFHAPTQPAVGAYAVDPSSPPPAPEPTPAPADPTIAQLQAQVASLQTQLAAVQGQLTTSQADAAAKAATIAQLQGQVDVALAKIAAAQAALK